MNVSAVKASFGRRIEAVNQADNLTLTGSDVLENAHKLGAGQVAYLATPQGLHPLHGEVFKEEMIIAVGQLMGQFKEPITALVDDPLINAGNVRFGLLPAVRELDFTGKVLLGGLQFSEGLTIIQRTFNFFSLRCGEKDFQPEVKARAVARHGLIIWINFFLNHKVEIEIAKTIPLDGDGLNIHWKITALAEFVDYVLNADTIIIKEFPTRLFECEGAILLDLLKARGSSLEILLEIAKKQTIGFVNAVNNVLNCLATNQIPVLVVRKLFQLGDMLHQGELVQALSGESVVFAVQRNAVVVDKPCNVNPLVQTLILFRPIQLEFVGLDDLHNPAFATLPLPNDQSCRLIFRPSTRPQASVCATLIALCVVAYIVRPYIQLYSKVSKSYV